MPQILSIFDFDQTLTQRHTFRVRCRTSSLTYDRNEYYQLGKIDAETQMKKGIENYLHHNDNQISAIATYHNNPAYIAGFVSAILKKDLAFNETIVSQDSPKTAIDVYTVEGQKHPFLISYIPEITGFSNTVKALTETGKNKQLSHLEQVIKEKNILSPAEKIKVEFYDDTEKNYSQAINLSFINHSHQIDATNHSFNIVNSLLKLNFSLNAPQQQELATEEGKLLSPSLFLQIMSSPALKVIGGMLILGGLAALGFIAMGTLGAGIGLGVGVGLCVGLSFFANNKKASDDAKPAQSVIYNQTNLLTN